MSEAQSYDKYGRHLKKYDKSNDVFLDSFFITRIVVVPTLWYNWVITNYAEEARVAEINGAEEMCFTDYLIHLVSGFGVLFHALNAYWMELIVKNVHRKITGKVVGKKTDWEASQAAAAMKKEE